MATRLRGRFGYPADQPFRVTLHPDRLDQPRHWRKPRRVFVNSMSDTFHPDVPFEFREKIWQTMFAAHWHTYMILTKRPQQMAKEWHSLESLGRGIVYWNGPPASNIWAGTTIEDQAAADERMKWLLKCPAAKRFISHEPALGAVNFDTWLDGSRFAPQWHESAEDALSPIHLLIAGGETGPGCRPTHPDVFRSDRDQCVAAGVPFFFKGWGDWKPYDATDGAEFVNRDRSFGGVAQDGFVCSKRVGKKAAGRLLDGRTWDEMPE